MPRTREVPSYRLHKSTGQAVVTLNGRDHYLGAHGTDESRQNYDRLIAEWLAAGRTLKPEPGAGLSVKAMLASYLEYASGYYRKDGKPTKQLDRVQRSIAPAVQLYGGEPANRFGPAALRAVRQTMVRKGWKRRVINQRVGCLVRAFKWAASEELIPGPVWQALKSVDGLRAGRCEAPESPPVKPVPEDHVDAVKPFLLPVLRDVVELQLLTACRPGEVLAMRACDLDRSGPVWVYRPATHKGAHLGHDKAILVGPRAQALLAPYLQRGEDGYLFSPRRAVVERMTELKMEVRFGKSRVPGERYAGTSYSHAVIRACRRAGVPDWHPHQLRHNAATRLVEQFGWDVARILLGHRHLSTTKIYAEDDFSKAAAAIAKVG